MSSQRRQAATPTTPHISAHARDRHDQRTSADAAAPETEWHEGQRVPAIPLFDSTEEVRYHEEGGVLLLRKGRAIATVLVLDEISETERNAVLGALGRC